MAEKKGKKLDTWSIITIAVAIIAFLAILFGVLYACGVFGKNTPGEQTAKITITIEVNGGTGNYNDVTFELDKNNTYTFSDDEIAAIKDALKKDGYELKGLSTTPDGEGGWTITIPKDAESPVTFYAIWEENTPSELAIFTHEDGVITGLTDYGKTLTEITIPSTLDGEDITGIGTYAFRECTNLTSVTIPESVTDIGEGAFYGCTSLTSIKIPDGITAITHNVFALCSSLISIEIPTSLTSVGIGAFGVCTKLTYIYYKGAVGSWNVYINNSASSNGNFKIENVYYYSIGKPSGEGNYWHYVGEVPTVWEIEPVEQAIFTHAGGVITGLTDYGKTLSEITIPNTLDGEEITGIGDSAFAMCEVLETVNIANGITSIGAHAFEECTNLTSVTIPESVTSLGYWAFSGCDGITSVTVPGSVTIIGANAFSYCRNLESVIIEEGVEDIDSYAFASCSKFDNLTIPSSVTRIRVSAFEGCTNLVSVIMPNSVNEISARAFFNCPSFTTVYYGGASSDDWALINIDNNYNYNEPLTDATRYYYSFDRPSDEGNYWHYVNDVPTVWVVDLLADAKLAAVAAVSDCENQALSDLYENSEANAELIRLIEGVAHNAVSSIYDATEIDGENGVNAIKDAAIAEIIRLQGFGGKSLAEIIGDAKTELQEYISAKKEPYFQPEDINLLDQLDSLYDDYMHQFDMCDLLSQVIEFLNEAKANIDDIVDEYEAQKAATIV